MIILYKVLRSMIFICFLATEIECIDWMIEDLKRDNAVSLFKAIWLVFNTILNVKIYNWI